MYMGVIANTYGLLTSADKGCIKTNLHLLDRYSYTRSCFSNGQLLCYTIERLFNIRRAVKNKPAHMPSDEQITNFKNLGIYKYRGCRGGKYKNRNITCRLYSTTAYDEIQHS